MGATGVGQVRKEEGNKEEVGGGGRVWRHAESPPHRAPGEQGAGRRAGGRGLGRRGRPRGPTGPEPGGRAGGLKKPADGQTDGAVTHKVESTTNSTGGVVFPYFMDECTVGFRNTPPPPPHPPPSGPRATGEPRRHAARAPERPALPAVARTETRPGLLGCPEGPAGGYVWTQCSRRAARPSADGCRMSKRRERGETPWRRERCRNPTLIKSGLLFSLV